MTVSTFSPREVWRGLPHTARETIGASALAVVVAEIGVEETLPATPYGDSLRAAREVLKRAVIDAAQPELFEEDGAPRLPVVEGLE